MAADDRAHEPAHGGTLCRSGDDFTAQLRVGRQHGVEADQM